ncbi:rubredoxin [Acanthopleuribacter pedis]|uniref:Rubredoxin n=1 Tax=Acanthopleuribacter pedis TaxID=442870 RepID=A0A8J7U6D1_9BACT|nr:rubredoxin [Acanthopleuribacter pedis]MBO1322667.1 rubredoxin [Acanthopleuribacter pedis]
MGGAFKKYVCLVCGFLYDEAVGDPEAGIAAGTRFEDLPETWFCADCGAGRADFEREGLSG